MEGQSPTVLVIGAGSIGSRHLRNLRAVGVKDLIACDPREDNLVKLAGELPGLRTFPDYRDALKAEVSIDAGFICSPTSYHMEQALELAHRDIALFIEKPLSHDQEGIADLLAEVNRRGLPTMMAMCYRFHPGVTRIRKLIKEDAIGSVYSVNFFSGQYLPDWHPWADYRTEYSANRSLGGGVILDSIHSLDSLRFIFGEPQDVIGCYGTVSDLEIDTEDLAAAVIRYPDGMIAEIHEDYLQRAKSSRCLFIGEKGNIEWTGGENLIRVSEAESKSWREITYDFSANEMYVAEIKHFLDNLAAGVPMSPDMADGVRTLALAEAVRRSWDERRVLPFAGEPLLKTVESLAG
jgi:predicted dehydrogenase